MSFDVLTSGVRELQAAFEDVKVKVDPVLGRALSAAAIPVRDDARQRADGYGARIAKGIVIRRRATAVRVEQSGRKTNGHHSGFGWYQQHHFFDPALADHQHEAIELTRVAMDELATRVNKAP